MIGSKPLFDIISLRDARLRGYYGDRYDVRNNLLDWDYSMRIKTIAPIVHIVHYRKWRNTGIAFEQRLVVVIHMMGRCSWTCHGVSVICCHVMGRRVVGQVISCHVRSWILCYIIPYSVNVNTINPIEHWYRIVMLKM